MVYDTACLWILLKASLHTRFAHEMIQIHGNFREFPAQVEALNRGCMAYLYTVKEIWS